VNPGPPVQLSQDLSYTERCRALSDQLRVAMGNISSAPWKDSSFCDRLCQMLRLQGGATEMALVEGKLVEVWVRDQTFQIEQWVVTWARRGDRVNV